MRIINRNVPLKPQNLMTQSERYQKAKHITLIGGLVNALLALVKLIGGALFNSHALIADGVHSLSDLVTDVMVIFASKYGSQAADESHPYGHQRIETAATLLLALFLILAGAGIAWDTFDEMLRHTYDTPTLLALPIALLSIIANEGLFHYTLHIGRHIESELIIANAWHHRSDAASSVVVLIGLMGSIAGFHYFDGIAAIIVSLMIIKMGFNYGWGSVKELVDTAVDSELLQQIQDVIQETHGVCHVHQLRSRMMGKDVLVDVHVQVEPTISVSEGHFIAQQVHQRLNSKFDAIKDVTVHIDPEDDEIVSPSSHLPHRAMVKDRDLLPIIKQHPFQSINLHYLDGMLEIDLYIDEQSSYTENLKQKIAKTLEQNQNIRTIRVFKEQLHLTKK